LKTIALLSKLRVFNKHGLSTNMVENPSLEGCSIKIFTHVACV
jgi:hypothetical protein